MVNAPVQLKRAPRALGGAGIVALAAVLLLLVGVAGASVWQASRNSTALARAQTTRAQRNNVGAILLAAQDAETSQRGFLLTLNPDYLDPLVHAEQVLPGLLKTLMQDRPGDPQVAAFQQVVVAKLAELRQTITLAQDDKLPDAVALVRSNLGRDSMVMIRQLVASLEGQLDVDLARRVAVVTSGGRFLIAIDFAGLVTVLGLAGLIGLGLRGYLQTMRAAQVARDEANVLLEMSNERLDETVRNRTADLTAANEEIQRFAYIVSHDLRAPLVNIMGFTSELEQAAQALSLHIKVEDTPPDLREAVLEDIPEALRFIKSSTSKMDRLINAILKLSREGRRVLAAEPLNMAGMLDAMADSMQHQTTLKEAKIEIATVPNITADRLAIEQVFTNVIDNALKYLKPGRPGLIRVQGRREGPMIRYEISDNGRGIAERDFERVFELFRRAGDQTVPGEGIGLAHVRALVRRLGGSIDCTSTLDVGTTFIIRLPVVAPNAMENAA
ncbi:ATP-binding protein [Acidisphaera sp. L21]|uniref:sensor histidine kinase n=1 Tax=Acidisphaera sp. L21 TaxID=1641851 RepID=UPI00131BB046|nr:ATP-binding protein [Acidisphaera sp. L21]